MKNIFVHHVFFWLRDAADEIAAQKLYEGLVKLSEVKTIREFHIGKPANTNRDVIENSYALSWMVIFENAADQDSYQSDPVHLQFIAECSSLWSRVQVFDSIDAR